MEEQILQQPVGINKSLRLLKIVFFFNQVSNGKAEAQKVKGTV